MTIEIVVTIATRSQFDKTLEAELSSISNELSFVSISSGRGRGASATRAAVMLCLASTTCIVERNKTKANATSMNDLCIFSNSEPKVK
jgi:hypothetical protein